jgi:L-threonylcarbamoyladenylate synthase
LPTIDFHIRQATRIMAGGGIIACPTEAVWGLGCDPWNEYAVERLLQLKRRPRRKGLILVAADMSQFDWLLGELTPAQHSRLELSWPGPITWLVPHGGKVPEWICGEFDTVALRVTAHPVLAQLCAVAGHPLVSTSANIGGAQPARQQFQVRRYFKDQIDYLVPGALGGRDMPSTIRDLVSDTVIRPG